MFTLIFLEGKFQVLRIFRIGTEKNLVAISQFHNYISKKKSGLKPHIMNETQDIFNPSRTGVRGIMPKFHNAFRLKIVDSVQDFGYSHRYFAAFEAQVKLNNHMIWEYLTPIIYDELSSRILNSGTKCRH